MKTLLIMRHAKSSWSEPSLTDHDRPLNARGYRDAPRMGELLRDQELQPDVIICSSAVRARTTAKEVAIACDYDGQLVVTRELYHAGPEDYIEVLRQLDDRLKIAMVVGHNPGAEELLEDLTGQWERMPTAAVANVRLDVERWSDLGDTPEGRLEALWLPRQFPE